MKDSSRALRLLFVLPYACAGVLAPFLFTTMRDPHQAGRITGAFFILSGLYGLYLCGRWHLHPYFKHTFSFVVLFELIFWSWRFLASSPLRDFQFAGITGSMLHMTASWLYLLGGVILLVGAYKAPAHRKRKSH